MEISTLLPRGIGPVHIGMSRDEIRAVLVDPVRTFHQGPFPEDEKYTNTDHFTAAGIQADYDSRGMCNFIVVTEEAMPTLSGKRLVGISISECKAFFNQLDSSLEIDDCGFHSRKLGIGIYASGGLSCPDDPVEAVSIFADDYYD